VETRAFETFLGPIWLQGESAAFSDRRPIVLAIAGAFAPADAFDLLALRLPQAAVLTGHIPGNHCPPLAASSPGAFMAAYSAAIAELGRPTIVCGASLGGLVALGLHAPNLVGLVALDPLISTAGLTYAIPVFREALRREHQPHEAELIWSIFGISLSTVEERSYAGVLEGLETPTWCLFGEVLPDRPQAGVPEPSIVSEAERELLGRHSAIHTQVAPGAGHHLHVDAPRLVLSAIRFFLDPLVAAGA
jgi:pimeloyl-ACP methyl ester carboxylesterase